MTIQIFDIAVQNKATRDSKKRGKNTSLKSTITVPHFKGLYRKERDNKKSLTGTFIISYFTCLAYCVVKYENAYRVLANKHLKKGDKLVPVVLNTFIIEALISAEGFSTDTYCQGKTTGAKRIERHLNDIELDVSVKDDVVQGLTVKIVNEVLSAI